jgi:hypothetical protein
LNPSGDKGTRFNRPLIYVLAAIIMAIILAAGLLAAVPPVSRDALTHHLAVPKIYIDHGRMVELPEIVPSYFPMNLDLLFLVPLIWGNDILPKYIHMVFGFLTAFFLYRYLRDRLNPIYGLLGVLFFLSLPIILQLSITVYVDLGLIFFSTAAIICLLEWEQGGWRSRKLIGAAIFCGLALGTKYNGLVVFLILTLMVPVLAGRKTATPAGPNAKATHSTAIVISTLLFVTIALLFFAPWALRNLVWTGNPLFPLYDAMFNPQNPYVETRLNPFAMRRLVYGESIWQTLLVPIRIFFQGQDDVPALFDGRLNPFLLPLAVVGLFSSKGQSSSLRFDKAVWGGYALLFILLVFFTRDMRIRYIAPAIPPLVILSVFGVKNLSDGFGRLSSRTAGQAFQIGTSLVVISFLVLNAGYFYQKWQQVRPMDYLSGETDRAAYITRHRPEYPVVQYANQHLTDGDRILCIFLGNRRYYFEIDTHFYEWAHFKKMVAAAPNAKAISVVLTEQGNTHVMLGLEGLQYWSQHNMTMEDQDKVRQWMKHHIELVTLRNNYALFKLSAGPAIK